MVALNHRDGDYAPCPPPIQPTWQEAAAGRLSDATVTSFVASFERDGFAVLGPFMPERLMDTLREQMDRSAARLVLEEGAELHLMDRGGFISNGLPRCAPWVRHELLSNSIVEQLAVAVLGPRPFVSYCAGSTNAPGCGARNKDGMRLHMDGVWAWRTPAEAVAEGAVFTGRCVRHVAFLSPASSLRACAILCS